MSTPRLCDLDGEDPYKLLGVATGASEADIIAAYRRRIRRLHPDLPGGSERSAKLLHVAKAILLDPQCRAEYDRILAAASQPDRAAESASAWDDEDIVTGATESPFSSRQATPPRSTSPPRTAGTDACVVFYRPMQYRDSLLRAYILKIDGVRCGKVRLGKEVAVDVTAGIHTAQAHIDWYSSPPLEFIVQPGQVMRVRVAPSSILRWLSESCNRARYLQLDID